MTRQPPPQPRLSSRRKRSAARNRAAPPETAPVAPVNASAAASPDPPPTAGAPVPKHQVSAFFPVPSHTSAIAVLRRPVESTGFTGVVVHDCWASYNAYTDCDHALCGAHIARELVAAEETHPAQHWPAQALDALFALNTAAHDARDQRLSGIPPDIAEPLLRAWRHAILVGLAEHPARPGRKQSKTRNLLERLHAREADVLRFAHDLTVPFSNNQAERDLRPTKTQMKISGTVRSEASATAWARIRGYVSTALKHGINAFDAIHAAITGNPWTPTPYQPGE
jgi:transposase